MLETSLGYVGASFLGAADQAERCPGFKLVAGRVGGALALSPRGRRAWVPTPRNLRGPGLPGAELRRK